MKHTIPCAFALVLFSLPALAHVTAKPDNGVAGSYFQTSLRMSHGCNGSATKVVRVKIPEGIIVARPQFKPGWTATIVKRKLPAPVAAGHGKMVDEAPAEIIWRGGPLPDDNYDDFGIAMKLPEKAGDVLWFPTVQECEKGENRWDEIPASIDAWHSLKGPAPYVKVTDK